MENPNYPIDIVLPYVDSTDPKWQEAFIKHKKAITKSSNVDIGVNRYRDNGLLRYLFRGFETFSPFINKIYFITCGHLPSFLNLKAKKLVWVRHEDFIPHEYLPTFQVRPIECYLHKIKNLSTHFVYFNDDFFLTSPVTPSLYFHKGLPCDEFVEYIQTPSNDIMNCIVRNNVIEINRHFNKKSVLHKNFSKIFNPCYKRAVLRNVVLSYFNYFVGFANPHYPQPYLKKTLEAVWNSCEGILTKTASHKFREKEDVNQWLFRYWQLCEGAFYATNIRKKRKYFELNSNGKYSIEDLCRAIEKQTYNTIVINDGDDAYDFDLYTKKLQASFQKILPNKSSFEL